ncbi:MAG: hypothetical protein WCG55_00035 [bacterium]
MKKIAFGVIATVFMMSGVSCKHIPSLEEKVQFTHDSLMNVVRSREKNNGVIMLSQKTLHELGQIYSALKNANPGDSIGKHSLKFSGDKVSLESIPGKIGGESGADSLSEFSFFLDSTRGIVRISCISDVKKSEYSDFMYSGKKSVYVSKIYDTSGVILSEYWEPFDVHTINGGVTYPGYRINYDRLNGNFIETLASFLYESERVVDINSSKGEFERVTNKRPQKFDDWSFSVGGSPEHFFQQSIKAFKQAK